MSEENLDQYQQFVVDYNEETKRESSEEKEDSDSSSKLSSTRHEFIKEAIPYKTLYTSLLEKRVSKYAFWIKAISIVLLVSDLPNS
jgi:hypothetical protein